MSVRISAIICTFNRSKYLQKAIQSLIDQTLEKYEYEILVVDNCSVDDTRKVVDDKSRIAGNLHYIYESEIGLSKARNTGWEAAKGEYIAYLDDDAIATPHWLATLLHNFENITPKPACIGGKIDPIWEAERPEWLPDKLLPYLTILDWSSELIIIDENQYIAGANMAFTQQALTLANGFQTKFGRRGKKLLSNEELVLQNQIRKHGLDIYYNPEAVVEHHVVADRLQQNWFVKRTYWQGVSRAFLIVSEQSPSVLQQWKMGVYSLLNLLKSPKRIVKSLLPSRNPRYLQARCSTASNIGYIVGLLTAKGGE
ncbi:GalNAc(5)-diNAcBac-PP-undecaprenol beta-1,3-glucosyltransferase [Acaryochloris thomasi RCC1774]|uniref:GalNAc(5)-diNAcBac-PP-undecaprenol beta-1,3-glucosyltransferase n=1 Tax=Acaryochloris thomasi RCC1774 TaxID=1764569 RepID=A0A2W1K0Y6_9CYAN|nr:glycosyltransferase family 2 protein [Acaryochloris thomasi]PZD74231.1 GalNAc(5)-diNAcBac-PP-undecaprenol beta-1,3-glucosyltransferase [Acaryochloris thomasi RCC1774]